MAAVALNWFRFEDEAPRCWACGSSQPPYPSDPPPPMSTPFALFFLIIGALMLTTIMVDPQGEALLSSAPHSTLSPLDHSGAASMATGFIAFGGVLLALTLKRGGKGTVRWICRRCGAIRDSDNGRPTHR